MIMPCPFPLPVHAQSSPREGLLLTQRRQNPKHDRRPRIKLDPHQAICDRLGDILKMHGLAFNQDADCYYRIRALVGDFAGDILDC